MVCARGSGERASRRITHAVSLSSLLAVSGSSGSSPCQKAGVGCCVCACCCRHAPSLQLMRGRIHPSIVRRLRLLEPQGLACGITAMGLVATNGRWAGRAKPSSSLHSDARTPGASGWSGGTRGAEHGAARLRNKDEGTSNSGVTPTQQPSESGRQRRATETQQTQSACDDHSSSEAETRKREGSQRPRRGEEESDSSGENGREAKRAREPRQARRSEGPMLRGRRKHVICQPTTTTQGATNTQ